MNFTQLLFLNKLKIVESANKKKGKIKHLWLSGPQTDEPAEPPCIVPDYKDGSVFALFNISFHFQYYSLHTNTYQNVKNMFS